METITATQAAEKLGITRRRVAQLVKAGILKAQWFGPILAIEVASLPAARRRCTTPGPKPKRKKPPRK